MDIKLAFAALSGFTYVIAYVPYLRAMLAGKTKPHIYTWLIWTFTTGTAALGSWQGEGGWGAVSQTVSALLTFLFFLLAFRFGTRDITRFDTILFVMALIAIVVWWKLENPVAAVLMAVTIDLVAYVPTFRKSFSDPWSENLGSWILFTFGIGFALAAVKHYNVLTAAFLSLTLIANVSLITLCLIKRQE